MVKVSVIIPVYNAEKYLQECLNSICNQTLKDIEIICINDCSTDNSLTILQEYASRDMRIKIIDFNENKGAAAARNAGIDAAYGDYIGFVDSDDFIDLDFYEKLYNKAVETNADAVKGKLYLFEPVAQKVYIEDWIDINDKVKKHKANFYFTFTTAIYNRQLILDNNVRFLENLVHFEDPYFTIKACLFYKNLETVDSAKYYYVDNKSSASRNISLKHAESVKNGSKQILDLINSADIDIEHYKIIFNFVMNQVLCWCNKSNCKDEINKVSANAMAQILDLCKYKSECIEFYFLEKKSACRNSLLKQLRGRLKDSKLENLKNA